MTEWKIYKLGELCSSVIDHRGKTPLKLGGNWVSSGYRALSAKNIKTGQIVQEETIRFVNDSLYKKWMKEEIERGCIIITSEAPFGEVYYWDSDEKIVLSQRLFGLKISKEYDSKFIYYYMRTHNFQEELRGRATGTTVIGLRQPELLKCHISLPPLEEQRRIAGILGAIDDKIENNRCINANLELQAQALYKQWFVDNRCDDWEIKSLSDLMDYQGGSQPPASEFIDKPQDGYVRFVQIRDYASNSHPTYIPIAKKNKLCNKKDIMIARYGASLGRICFGLEGAYNVALAKVKPLEDYYREFLRCYLSSNEFYDGINMKGNRAVQAGFNQSDINSFMISCPKQDIFVAFENIVSKILDKRLMLQQENETLATLRDTLLPKLMNGEIKL